MVEKIARNLDKLFSSFYVPNCLRLQTSSSICIWQWHNIQYSIQKQDTIIISCIHINSVFKYLSFKLGPKIFCIWKKKDDKRLHCTQYNTAGKIKISKQSPDLVQGKLYKIKILVKMN